MNRRTLLKLLSLLPWLRSLFDPAPEVVKVPDVSEREKRWNRVARGEFPLGEFLQPIVGIKGGDSKVRIDWFPVYQSKEQT